MPGLAEAFKREPVVLDLELHRLNGKVASARVQIPDELVALVLKLAIWQKRREQRDALDIWRCVEVAFAAGASKGDLANVFPHVAKALRHAVKKRDGALVAGIANYRGLSREAGDRLHTRLVALVERV